MRFSIERSEGPHLDVTLAGISLCNRELQRLVERMVDLSKRTCTHINFIFHNKTSHKVHEMVTFKNILNTRETSVEMHSLFLGSEGELVLTGLEEGGGRDGCWTFWGTGVGWL